MPTVWTEYKVSARALKQKPAFDLFTAAHPTHIQNTVLASKSLIMQQLIGCSVSLYFCFLCVCLSLCLFDNSKHYINNITLVMSICLSHSADFTLFISLCLCEYVNIVILLPSLSLYQYLMSIWSIDVSMLTSLYLYHSVGVTMSMSLCWSRDMWFSNISIARDDWSIKNWTT